MIDGKLTLIDRIPHGPYEGRLVSEVLAVDPEELTAFSSDGCTPVYDVSPAVLKAAYDRIQDRLGWDEFIALWDRSG